MAEKADLLDQLQENEHVIMQLSGETETIGKHYLALLYSANLLSTHYCKVKKSLLGL